MHRVPVNSQSNDSLIDKWSFTKNFTTFEKLPCNSQLGDIDFSRVIEIYKRLVPLTLPHTDAEGNTLQLWKAEKYGLIGSVIDRSGKVRIVQSEDALKIAA